MFDRDKWNEILEALTANTFRTILTALVCFGDFYFGHLACCWKWFRKQSEKGFDGIATNTMFMWSQTTSKPYKGLPANRKFNLKMQMLLR